MGNMKYMFTPPYNLCGTFERKFGVVIDAVRPKGKGGGKGEGKGALPKEVCVYAESQEALDSAVADLKKLDLTGSITMDVPEKARFRREDAEEGLEVVVIRRGTDVSIIGTKADVKKAEAKVQELIKKEPEQRVEVKSDTVDIPEEKVKCVQDQMYGWKGSIKDVQMRIVGLKEKTPKMLFTGKNPTDIDDAKQKIEKFIKDTEVTLCKASEENLTRLYSNEKTVSRNPYIKISRSFIDLRAMNEMVAYFTRKVDGVQIVGPKKTVNELKAKVNEMLEKVDNDPTIRELKSKTATSIFTKDGNMTIRDIAEKSGAEIDVDGSSDQLVIIGDSTQVEKALAAVDEILEKEGTVEELACSEAAFSALKAKGGEKIKDIEGEYKVIVNADRKEGKVTIIGAKANVQKAHKNVQKFIEEADAFAKDSITEHIDVEEDEIPRIIGKKGANVNRIRLTTGCRVDVEKDPPGRVCLKGLPDGVAKAKEMIADLLAERKGGDRDNGPVDDEPAKPVAKSPASPPKKENKKKPSEYRQATGDFPDLGGAPSPEKKEKNPAGHWGKKAEEDAKKNEPKDAKEDFPTAKEANKKAAAPADEEEAEDDESSDSEDSDKEEAPEEAAPEGMLTL